MSLGQMETWAMVWSQRLGVPVLPCGPDKAPLTRGGKDEATTDPDQVARWWAEWPDALIGGRADGLVILDFDAYKDGHDADLKELGDLPTTREFRTPGLLGTHGRHLVYRGDRRSGKLGANRTIDVRGGASRDYVILPPSRGSAGQYEAVRWCPVAPAPGWLLDARPAHAGDAGDGLPDAEPVPSGVTFMVPRTSDPSEHTYLLIKAGMAAGLSEGQLLALAESDEVTTIRRSEVKRQQPGWWAGEFSRCVDLARAEVIFGEGDEKRTVAQRLVAIAMRDFDLVRSPENVVYGVPRSGPKVAAPLRGGSGSLRASLSAQFSVETGHVPSNGALADVLTNLEGKAAIRPVRDLPMRTAWHDGRIVLDLGDPSGRVVVVGPGSWDVLPESPVLFRRTDLTRALPVPVRGGRLTQELYPRMNLPEADRALMVACVLSWLWPSIDHPVVYLRGEEGTAKTSMARTLRSLIDPSIPEVRRQPGRDEDWEVTIAGQPVVVLDNLSVLPDWLSDAICTAVTGTGDVKRRKYSDQDLSVVEVRRSFILTSIDTLVSRGDLIDRTILFEPEPIQQFRTQSELNRSWAAARPLALGALLDLAAHVLAVLPEVEQSGDFTRERMADFVHICAAMDRATGSHAVDRYRHKVSEGIRASVETDAFAVHVIALSERGWSGTAQELYNTYKARLARPGASDSWPKSPVAMGMRLRRLSGVLRKSGVVLEHRHTREGKRWLLSRA